MKRFSGALAIISLLVLGLAAGGCDLTELNDDPNSPTEATTEKLLTNAQIDLANIYWRDYPGGFWVRYAQYFTTNQYTDGDRFRFPERRAGANNANWANWYQVQNDLQEIVRINQQSPQEASAFGPNENQIAIANILQAWTYQLMTDIWGPIPFEQAIEGRTEGNFTPEYTSQEEIYMALIDSVTTASNMIDPDTPALAASDLMYGGDMSKWKKFANALKMRLAIRMSDRRPEAAATAINEAIAAGAFEDNSDNAVIPFNQSAPYQNPFYENYEVEGRDDWAAPEAIVSAMNEREDPRRAAYFTDAQPDVEGNQYIGFPYGLEQGEAQPLFTSEPFSRPGLDIRQATSPAILMLYDEVLFTKAEAALRTDMSVPNIDESGEQLYRDAIRASMQRWGVTDEGEVDAYLDEVDTPTAENYEQVLGVQKWLALYPQGVQGWSVWRRTDFQGVLQVPPGDPGSASFGREIAVRMAYPRDESTLNGENLEEAVNNLLGGPDDQGTLLWWDTEYEAP